MYLGDNYKYEKKIIKPQNSFTINLKNVGYNYKFVEEKNLNIRFLQKKPIVVFKDHFSSKNWSVQYFQIG